MRLSTETSLTNSYTIGGLTNHLQRGIILLMITELTFIDLFLQRENYIKYRGFLPLKDLEKPVADLLTHVDSWYQTNSEGDMTVNDLYIRALPHIDKSALVSMCKNLKGLQNSTSAIEALKDYKRQKLHEDISITALEASQGRTEAQRNLSELYKELEAVDSSLEESADPFFDDDLENVLKATDRTGGLRFRLKALQNILGNILPGEFGFFVARPETGKTTMLASEITYMASQLKEDDGPIIWFNNEEPGAKVSLRLYQAALGATDDDIRKNVQKAKESYTKTTHKKIKLIDRDYLYKREVESICFKYNPSLIILDQIDPIKGFKADREDLRLGEIYKWARSLGKKYSMPVIAVCQADGQAEGVQWLKMDNVANAKTEKQAAADWIVGIGKVSDPAFQNVRYLASMKNKLTGVHGRMTVLIKPSIGRYEDME